jgi:hypothetical protein
VAVPRRVATHAVVAALVLAALVLAARPAWADDEEGPPRLSLATESDRAAWRRAGFRIALGLGYGQFEGLGGAPSGRLIGPVIRVGLRLDEAWSLMGSFEYLSASEDGGLSGLRFAGILEPTLHLSQSFSVGLGLGFGGIVEGRTNRVDPEPLASTLNTSYTFPDASTPLASCNGIGLAGRVRADWMYVLGPRASTGLGLAIDGQWTGCVDDANRVEPDTARPIVRRQWWPHVGVMLSWQIAWR